MISRREAFRLGGGTTLAALVGTGLFTVSCTPTPAPAATADPILDLIAEYRKQMAIYNASGDLTDEADDALAEATYKRSWDQLRTEPPAITTEAGAVAALKLAAEEMEHSYGSFELPVIRAVVAYFNGRASR